MEGNEFIACTQSTTGVIGCSVEWQPPYVPERLCRGYNNKPLWEVANKNNRDKSILYYNLVLWKIILSCFSLFIFILVLLPHRLFVSRSPKQVHVFITSTLLGYLSIQRGSWSNAFHLPPFTPPFPHSPNTSFPPGLLMFFKESCFLPSCACCGENRLSTTAKCKLRNVFRFVPGNSVTRSIIFIDSSGGFVKLNFPDFLQSGRQQLHNAPEITGPAVTLCPFTRGPDLIL